jgi:hypothetical protein
MDGSNASMNPNMLGAAMQLMGNKKGQSPLPALGQAAMSMNQKQVGLGVKNPAQLVTNGQPNGLAINWQRPSIGSQQMIPQYSGGAGQFLSGPSSQMGGYQSQMWNQQRANPNLNFQAPVISQMPAPQYGQPQQYPGQYPGMPPGQQPITNLSDLRNLYRD